MGRLFVAPRESARLARQDLFCSEEVRMARVSCGVNAVAKCDFFFFWLRFAKYGN